MKIPLFTTYVHPSATSRIKRVLSSTMLSEGEVVAQFEKKLERSLSIKNCVAVNSGTSALHLALSLAGIKQGDEVILPAQTFVATGLVILQQLATPVFADIEYGTGNISMKSINEKISPRTKAIIPVHWAGYPCDMTEINALARRNGITVIEDAAHALGATYKNKPVGSLSDYTCFSFQAIKHVTTGDGGAVCTIRNDDYTRAITGRWFGINRTNSPMGELGERKYNINSLGYKYHLNNYSAALGLANLENFATRLKKRIRLAALYQRKLKGFGGLQLFDYMKDRQSSYWMFGMHVENRIGFIRKMKENGIAASVVHQRIDRNDIFGGVTEGLAGQERFDKTQVHIPVHDDIDSEKAEFIIQTIRKGW